MTDGLPAAKLLNKPMNDFLRPAGQIVGGCAGVKNPFLEFFRRQRLPAPISADFSRELDEDAAHGFKHCIRIKNEGFLSGTQTPGVISRAEDGLLTENSAVHIPDLFVVVRI